MEKKENNQNNQKKNLLVRIKKFFNEHHYQILNLIILYISFNYLLGPVFHFPLKSKYNQGGGLPSFKAQHFSSPLETSISMMTWILQNTLLLMAFIGLLILIPSVPIVLYSILLYLILKRILGKIETV